MVDLILSLLAIAISAKLIILQAKVNKEEKKKGKKKVEEGMQGFC